MHTRSAAPQLLDKTQRAQADQACKGERKRTGSVRSLALQIVAPIDQKARRSLIRVWGKTMLAERLPTIMPSLEPAAALEVSSIHSVAGALRPDRPLVTEPPFCAPHHTATKAAIVSGGGGIIRPGAASPLREDGWQRPGVGSFSL